VAAVVVLVIVVSAFVTACTGGPESTAPAPGSIAPAVTGAPGTTASKWTPKQQEVVDAYLAAVHAELDASEVPDPNFPALVQTHSGALLAAFQERFADQRAAGERGRLPENTKFRVDVEEVEVTGPADAVLISCTVDDGVVFVASTGSVINNDVSALRLRATLAEDDVGWKVSDRQVLSQQEGETCADS
jgi:hypothetical protein